MCSLLTPNAWPDALNPLFLKKAGVFEVDPFLDLKKFISRLVHNFFAQFLLFLYRGGWNAQKSGCTQSTQFFFFSYPVSWYHSTHIMVF